jgi:hypothetical protein
MIGLGRAPDLNAASWQGDVAAMLPGEVGVGGRAAVAIGAVAGGAHRGGELLAALEVGLGRLASAAATLAYTDAMSRRKNP